MMTCFEVREHLIDFATGRLEYACAQELQVHLRACEECVGIVDEARRLVRLSHVACRTMQLPGPGDVPPSLVQAIQSLLASAAGATGPA